MSDGPVHIWDVMYEGWECTECDHFCSSASPCDCCLAEVGVFYG